MRKMILPFLILSIGLCALAQEADPTKLSLERLYGGRELRAKSPRSGTWVEGQESLFAIEDSATLEEGQDLVRYDVQSNNREILLEAAKLLVGEPPKPMSIEDFSFSPDQSKMLIFTNSQRVWRLNTKGDYWVVDLKTGNKQQIGVGFPASTLMFAKFSPDGNQVAYVQAHNIYTENLATGARQQLTHDGSETTINGTFDWVYEEEFSLRDGFRWSPDSTSIAYWQLDAAKVGIFNMINNTDDLYSRIIPLQYPKAGTANSSCRTGVVSLATGKTQWIQLEGDPSQNYIASLEWVDQNGLFLQYLNRKQNHLQLMYAEAATGKTRVVISEKDDAWVEVVEDLVFLDNGKKFTWSSEREGFRRIYLYDLQGKQLAALTPADYDVVKVESIVEKAGYLYYTAAPTNPLQRYLFRVPLKGGKPERVTPAQFEGWNGYEISPDQKWAFHTYSNFATPPVYRIVALPAHKEVRLLEDNKVLADKLAQVKLGSHEFLKVDIGEITLDAHMIKPPGFDPSKKYPILFEVYGEPAGQTVTDRFSSKLLFDFYLAQEGYIVCSIDNRGTASPRGHDWRKSIYQKIGVLTSADQAAAARAIMNARPYIDQNAVAIWGWSGGGSQTLNAMFRYPDLYKTGMAVAPVPDMRYYDTIYQERYTGLPEEGDAYKIGSPITYAENLVGNLLLVHGTGDDNVHYQGTEALINKLVTHNKVFDMMAYPNRSHGIFEGKGTTLHLYSLLTRYLMTHHRPGPY